MSCGTTSVGMKRGREDGDAEDSRQVKRPRTAAEEEERRMDRELFGELSDDEVDDAAGEDVAEGEEAEEGRRDRELVGELSEDKVDDAAGEDVAGDEEGKEREGEEGKEREGEEDLFGEGLSEEQQDAALKEGFAEGRMDSVSAENDGVRTWELALPKQVLHQQKGDDAAACVALQEPDEDEASDDGLLYVFSEEELQEYGKTAVQRHAKEKAAYEAKELLRAQQEEKAAKDREEAAFLAMSRPVAEDAGVALQEPEGDDAPDDGLLEVVSEEESQETGSSGEESAAEERQGRLYDDLVLALQEKPSKGGVGEEEESEMGGTGDTREAEDAGASAEELAQLALEEQEAKEWEAEEAAASALSVEGGLPTPPTSQPQSDVEETVPQSHASEGSSPASPDDDDDDDDSAPGRKRKGRKGKNGAEVNAASIRNTVAATSVFTGRKRRCWETCVPAPSLSDRLPASTASEVTTTQTSLPPVTGENSAPIDLTAPTKRERKALLKRKHEERKAIREREFAEKYVVPIPVDDEEDAPAPAPSQEEIAAKYGSIPTLREQAGHEAEAFSHPEGHVKEKRAKKAANMARWRASQKRN
ncbi:hypothetical protein CKM354_000064800 [Cercospora kikuchii]|uniref:Uncharacterized protein n=1 Tax=Cercospora kikuchii TaxID=84275 RepID=A0A9P3C9B8_9PEZI|nr:uncharacterized protein CKM354_000064800 [Cercospora kikuchii]GIZ37191.1 hypothetical protein CKM354_000064800 [Cercospora kikuchii]